jgi:aspartate kinase
MRIVMKFGGGALKDAAGVEQVAKVTKSFADEEHQLILTVSALSGVTDSLIEMMGRITSARKSWIDGAIDSLASTHIGAIKGITDEKIAQRAIKTVRAQLDDLRNVVLGMTHVGELTPRSKDLLLSFGERLSTPIIASAIEAKGLRTEPLTGGEAGILTDENFGGAEPLMNVTSMQAKQALEPILADGTMPVIAGYIGMTQQGVITTLGRGGSDYTAAVIGLSLKADELWFWKDVPGIMTADPSLCSNSKLIAKIAFDEAIEIAHFGARVIHPRALEVGLESDLTYRIKSIWNPENDGTLIVRSADEKEGDGATIRAISVIDKVYLINISGARLVGTPSVAARVLDLLANENVDVLMISQSSSEANMSIAVPGADADTAMNALELSLLGSKLVREIKGEEGYCIVAAVGRGMRGTPGVAAKVFKSMADRCINIRTIAQGSSELNISFMVSSKDEKAAVQALHDDFGLSRASK